ncbi:hypothetical protein HRbin13_00261 [bacterium HR13]|nr:hypothetical protein HRbin13_00261 [bacterium HR13]
MEIMELCEVAGVQWCIVPAFNTSRSCPQCGYVDSANRDGEWFHCIRCGYMRMMLMWLVL